MTDEQELSIAFTRITQLADAAGVVPDDGSGLDGTWQTQIDDPDHDEPWYIGINADLDDAQEVHYPAPHGRMELDPGHAVVLFADAFGPAAVLTPTDGSFQVSGGQFDDRTTEDQLIRAMEHELDAQGFDYNAGGGQADG